MSGHKAKKHREEQEAIMFGKMCGCGKCRYCDIYRREQVWEHMGQLIREQTPTKAGEYRQQLIKELIHEHKQTKR